MPIANRGILCHRFSAFVPVLVGPVGSTSVAAAAEDIAGHIHLAEEDMRLAGVGAAVVVVDSTVAMPFRMYRKVSLLGLMINGVQ